MLVHFTATLLEKDHRVLRRNIELLPARLARHRVVHPNHVVAEFPEQRTVALIGPGRNAILLRSNHPAHLILVGAPAPRTGELVDAGLVAVVEEIAFVERHAAIILSF